jgi:type IV secretory pathway VirB10-like protein
MKVFVSVILSLALLCSAVPSNAEPRQVIPGTQIHLTLLNGISSAAAREGDPIIAVVADPVFLGNTLLIPAGTRVNGVVGTIQKAKTFLSSVARLT